MRRAASITTRHLEHRTMRKREKDGLLLLIGDDKVLFSEKVRFAVGIGSSLQEAHMVSTKSRLFFCRAIPMGCETSVVWYKDVERITTGKKKGHPYLQLLGDTSRVLIEFNSKRLREHYKKTCLRGIASGTRK